MPYNTPGYLSDFTWYLLVSSMSALQKSYLSKIKHVWVGLPVSSLSCGVFGFDVVCNGWVAVILLSINFENPQDEIFSLQLSLHIGFCSDPLLSCSKIMVLAWSLFYNCGLYSILIHTQNANTIKCVCLSSPKNTQSRREREALGVIWEVVSQ